MRRPAWLRAVTALWALWFAVALIEPPGIHQCPVHGAAGQTADMGAMPGMDMGGMSMSHEHAQPDGQQSQPVQCCCLSLCCCTPAFVTPAPTGASSERIVVRTAASNFADVPCPIIERAHALPFANGPPSAV